MFPFFNIRIITLIYFPLDLLWDHLFISNYYTVHNHSRLFFWVIFSVSLPPSLRQNISHETIQSYTRTYTSFTVVLGVPPDSLLPRPVSLFVQVSESPSSYEPYKVLSVPSLVKWFYLSWPILRLNIPSFKFLVETCNIIFNTSRGSLSLGWICVTQKIDSILFF